MSSGIMTSAPCVRLAPATGATTFRSRVVITTGHTFLSGLLYHPYNLYKVRLTTAFPHFSEPRSLFIARVCLKSSKTMKITFSTLAALGLLALTGAAVLPVSPQTLISLLNFMRIVQY